MRPEELLLPGERLDDLEIQGLRLIQNPACFCYGTDAVLLADFAKAREGERVADLCTGSGVIPLLMWAKTKARAFFALELQEQMADMAARSVAYNQLEDRIQVVQGDVRDAAGLLGKSSMQVVTVNPPYMKTAGGLTNPNPLLAMARHEITTDLDTILLSASELLCPGGRLYMVHRPHRLSEIFAGCKKAALEPKGMRFVHPRRDQKPVLVLIEALKGGNPWLNVAPPLILYREAGIYTDEVLKIYGR